jgi:Rod binding domain-containing protein
MASFSLQSAPLIRTSASAPGASSSGDADQKRSAIARTAQDFEASFLSSMLGEMFQGLDGSGAFDGGAGEAMFRSVMTDSMGKQIARAGGVGVAAAVQREMLKMQGLA